MNKKSTINNKSARAKALQQILKQLFILNAAYAIRQKQLEEFSKIDLNIEAELYLSN